MNQLFGLQHRRRTDPVILYNQSNKLPMSHLKNSSMGTPPAHTGTVREVNPESWTQLKGSDET